MKISKKSIWNLKRLSSTAIISEKVDNIIQSHQSDLYKETTTSIGDTQEDENTLSIYPNPATNIVQINWSGTSDKADLLILNQMGQLVSNKKNISQDYLVEVTDLLPGLYFIHLFVPSHFSVIKFIKL
ncbi:MAG: T9SS type A sorting domain-containing protein [Saprospiraceae bacterium]|nr:T9SS type A sorting domain-containing protein [Saprospiraceae bacterium]